MHNIIYYSPEYVLECQNPEKRTEKSAKKGIHWEMLKKEQKHVEKCSKRNKSMLKMFKKEQKWVEK